MLLLLDVSKLICLTLQLRFRFRVLAFLEGLCLPELNLLHVPDFFSLRCIR